MTDIATLVRGILEELGEEPDRQGLQRTPERVEKSLRFLTQGYGQSASKVIGDALFHENHNNMVLVRDIEFYSMCEHHMLPFFGKAHVAYIPNGRIVGLSKMARVVDVFARRLQVQERMTDQIADALVHELMPHGVGVVLDAAHLCMMMRGVQKQGSTTITSAMRGSFLDDPRTREEFLRLVHGDAMMQLTFLGTSAALPTVDRNVSGLMVQREGELLMFDCGEGTQRQMMRYTSGFAVEDIFITHYHSDHILGIPGLLRTMGLQGRTAPVRLHGPRGAQRNLGPLITLGMERPKFPVEIVELRADEILNRGEYDIVVGAASHKGECFSYAIVERDRLGRFDPERARSLGIPEGPLWGRIHKGESVTLSDGRVVAPGELVGPTRSGRTVVISGDTSPSRAVQHLATGADLLVHEATFGEDEADRARETGHSTARDAAVIARDAGVKRLVLTHISARYTRDAPELLSEARSVFPETAIARDGMEIDVPFRE